MEDFFQILYFSCIVCIFLGFIKPTIFQFLFKENASSLKVFVYFFLIFILCLISHKFLLTREKGHNVVEVLTKEDSIKTAINQVFHGTNNAGKKILILVEVLNLEKGTQVKVFFNASENLSKNLIKTGIEMDMSKLYYKLYTSKIKIDLVTIGANIELFDKFGNTTDELVYESTLSKDIANKINWKADQSSLFLTILPNNWNTTVLHPALLD